MCTNRPSLSPKGEISRNIVGVVETAPPRVSQLFTYNEINVYTNKLLCITNLINYHPHQ